MGVPVNEAQLPSYCQPLLARVPVGASLLRYHLSVSTMPCAGRTTNSDENISASRTTAEGLDRRIRHFLPVLARARRNVVNGRPELAQFAYRTTGQAGKCSPRRTVVQSEKPGNRKKLQPPP